MWRPEARRVRTPLSDVLSASSRLISADWRIAPVAALVVNANCASAAGAAVLRPLCQEECLYATLLDLDQVLDHAHVIFRSVSSVQMLQPITWKILTLKTESCSLVLENFASLDSALGDGNALANIRSPATRTLILLSQVCHADPAVHSARCDQAFLHARLCHAVAQLLPRKCSTKLANSSRSSQPSFR